MRSNLKHLAVFFCLLAMALVTQAFATGPLADAEPGSVLVFPLFETGVNLTPVGAAVPRSQFEISVSCPNGSVCPDGTDVDIRLHWVCFNTNGLGGICAERDFTLHTTVNGTILFDPQGNCEPVNSANNFFDTCGNIPPPPCNEGYLLAWVVDEAGRAIKFDGMIGDSVLRETPTAVTAYNAFPIQAGAKLATGASTDLYHNGNLVFNGQAYKELTNTIIGSVHYDGVNPTSNVLTQTSLVLLTLDTLSNRFNYPVFVDVNFYNEIEQLNSNNTAFFCGEEVSLGSLGETTTFGTKGLVQSTRAVKTPVLGISDKSGPVTLLGLVLTREDGGLRHYTYPLFNNSIPLPTSFHP